MSTELSVAVDRGQSLAELMGVSTGASTSASPSIARLNVNQNPIEAEVEFNGKMLKDEVVPKGAYKLTVGDETIYSKTATVRIFAVRQQWQRWNGDTEEMEKTVLSNSLSADLKDSIGGFNLGRPNKYFSPEEYAALDEGTKKIMASVKRVKVYYGLVTMDNPVDEQGNVITQSYEAIPFVFDVKNRESLKALDGVMSSISRKNLLPIMHTINLSPAVGSIPTGATYGYVSAALGNKVDIAEEDNDTLKNFIEYIEYVNGTIIDKHTERNSSAMSDADKEIIASIVEVDE